MYSYKHITWHCLLVAIFSGFCFTSCGGKRIMLLTFPGKSHMLELAQLGGALVKKGHEVYIVNHIGTSFTDVFVKQGITLLNYGHLKEANAGEKEDVDAQMTRSIVDGLSTSSKEVDVVEIARGVSKTALKQGIPMFSDDKFLKQVESLNFDLAIVDGIILYFFNYLLPYKMDIPYITYTVASEPSLFGTPALPSFSPSLIKPFSEKMSFLERLENGMLTFGLPYMIETFAGSSASLSSKYVPAKPHISLTQLAQQSKLWLLSTDSVLDYPRVSLPHIVRVGGMTTKPAKALDNEFAKIIKKAENGIFLVSFGSTANDIPKKITDKLLSVFSKLSETVIFRYGGPALENVPSNTHIYKWIPQNDLLGSPKIKAFMTHCGNNGQHEALYHGVPMVGFPLFGDQVSNAVRLEYHRYGLKVIPTDFTEEELLMKIREVIQTQSYRENIQKASRIFKSRRDTPTERAVYWVEHVIEFGSDHLLSYGLQMPWYQYWMVDIMAFIAAVVVVILYVVYVLSKFMYSTCTRLMNGNKLKQS